MLYLLNSLRVDNSPNSKEFKSDHKSTNIMIDLSTGRRNKPYLSKLGLARRIGDMMEVWFALRVAHH